MGFKLKQHAASSQWGLSSKPHSQWDPNALLRECYYEGGQVEILSLTKPDSIRDFTFVTLTTEEASEELLINTLVCNYEKLKVSATKGKEFGIAKNYYHICHK